MACFYPCLSCGVRIFTPFSLLGSCEKRHRWKGKKGHPHLLKKQNDVVLLNHEKESENLQKTHRTESVWCPFCQISCGGKGDPMIYIRFQLGQVSLSVDSERILLGFRTETTCHGFHQNTPVWGRMATLKGSLPIDPQSNHARTIN